MWLVYYRVNYHFLKGIPFFMFVHFTSRHPEGIFFSMTYIVCSTLSQRSPLFARLLHFCLSWKRFKNQFFLHNFWGTYSISTNKCKRKEDEENKLIYFRRFQGEALCGEDSDGWFTRTSCDPDSWFTPTSCESGERFNLRFLKKNNPL